MFHQFFSKLFPSKPAPSFFSVVLHLSETCFMLLLLFHRFILSIYLRYPTSLYDMGYRWDIYGISMGYLRNNLKQV